MRNAFNCSWARATKAARFAALIGAICACSMHAEAAAPTLDQLLSSQGAAADGSGIPEARYEALVETGRTRGNAAGLAWQSQQIAARLEKIATKLDVIYNFSALMMEGNVLPPVMSKAKDVYDQKDDSTIMLIGERYDIRQPPRFTYTAPSWRSYLLLSDYGFDINSPSLLKPEGAAEEAVWKKSVAEGYAMGIDQANSILDANFARLKQDFEGMLLYRELLRRGMVTKPFVSVGHYGVTGDKKKGVSVGESILRIQVAPEFIMDQEKWKTRPEGQAAALLQAAQNAVINETSGVVSGDSGDQPPAKPQGVKGYRRANRQGEQ